MRTNFAGHAGVIPGIGGVVTGTANQGTQMAIGLEAPLSTDASRSAAVPAIDEIIDNFSLLDEWDDRYRYVIELGRGMSAMSDADRTDTNKVQGCASQVWLATAARLDGDKPVLDFCGDSDAHIVRGLVAILLATVSGKRATEILATDPIALFDRLGLREHLTPQRSNGFRSMVARIRSDARLALSNSL
jgi:cysteine desulfuration protein SufE